MLDVLNFVKGAVAKKDFIPALTHYSIVDGFIQGSNGVITLNSPIGIDFNATPNGLQFLKAVNACKVETSLTLTKAGRISVKSGKFKAFVECTEEKVPHIYPEGKKIPVSETFLEDIKDITAFMSIDASRPWAHGILLEGQSAFATNNIVLVQKWLCEEFPQKVNIPRAAINELFRLKLKPISIQFGKGNMTFNFEDEQWLRTSLLSADWPNVESMLDVEVDDNFVDVTEELINSLRDIKPFVTDTNAVYFSEGQLRTHPTDKEGAFFETGLHELQGKYNIEPLLKVFSQAETINMSQHPKPAIFYGDNLRGLIIGMADVKV